MIRRKIVLILAVLLLFQRVAFGEDSIDHVKVQMDIHKEGIITVEEIITTKPGEMPEVFTRRIPLHYQGYNHPVTDIQVKEAITRKDLNFTVEDHYNAKVLKIDTSSKDVGSIKLTYSFHLYDNFSKGEENLMIQLGDSQWLSYIPLMQFRIRLPEGVEVDPKRVSFALTEDEGPEDVIRYVTKGNSILGEVSYLYPYQSVTMNMSFPQGFFNYQKTPVKTTWFFILYGGFVFCIVVMILYYAFRKKPYYHGKAHLFQLKDVPFMEVDAIERKKLSTVDIPGLILYWASKGYLKITKKVDDYVIEKKISELSEGESQWERYVYDQVLFHEKGSLMDLQLTKESQKELVGIKEHVKDQLHKEKVRFNASQFLPLLVMFVLLGVMAYFLAMSFNLQTGLGMMVSFAMLFALELFSAFFLSRIFKGRLSKTQKARKYFIAVFYFLPLMAVYLYISLNGIGGIVNFRSLSLSPIAFAMKWNRWVFYGFLLASILGAMLIHVKKDSPKYVEKLTKIYGLKDFLTQAKEEEINSIEYEIPAYYEKMLGYVHLFRAMPHWRSLKNRVRNTKITWSTDEEFDLDDFLEFLYKKLG